MLELKSMTTYVNIIFDVTETNYVMNTDYSAGQSKLSMNWSYLLQFILQIKVFCAFNAGLEIFPKMRTT